ncbi:MAG: fasciclin domain-containing protein [Phormidesmis sp.]
MPNPMPNPTPNIVEIAVNTEGFSTLVAAVTAAGLVEALSGDGPFTVFAPNDDAFAKLPPGTVQTLVDNPPQLARILKYHVASGAWTQSDLAEKAQLPSLESSPIPIRVTPDFEVKNATVLAADIEASNGIIHVIDTVILMG